MTQLNLDADALTAFFEDTYAIYTSKKIDNSILFEMMNSTPIPLPIHDFTQQIYLLSSKSYVMIRNMDSRCKVYVFGDANSNQFNAALNLLTGKRFVETDPANVPGLIYKSGDEVKTNDYFFDIDDLMSDSQRLLRAFEKREKTELTNEMLIFIANYYKTQRAQNPTKNLYQVFQIDLDNLQMRQLQSTSLVIFDQRRKFCYLLIKKAEYQLVHLERAESFQQKAFLMDIKTQFAGFKENDKLTQQLYEDATSEPYFYDFCCAFKFPNTQEQREKIRPDLQERFDVNQLFTQEPVSVLKLAINELDEIASSSMCCSNYLELPPGFYIVQQESQTYLYFNTEDRNNQLLAYAFDKNIPLVYQGQEPLCFTTLFGLLPKRTKVIAQYNEVEEKRLVRPISEQLQLKQSMYEFGVESELPKNYRLLAIQSHSSLDQQQRMNNVLDYDDYQTVEKVRVLFLFSSATQSLLYKTRPLSMTQSGQIPEYHCFLIKGCHSLNKQTVQHQAIVKQEVGSSQIIFKIYDQFNEPDFLLNEYDMIVHYLGSNQSSQQWKFRAIFPINDRLQLQLFKVSRHTNSNKVLVFQEQLIFSGAQKVVVDPMFCYIFVDYINNQYTIIKGQYSESVIFDRLFKNAAKVLCIDDLMYLDTAEYSKAKNRIHFDLVQFQVKNIGLDKQFFSVEITDHVLINHISGIAWSDNTSQVYIIKYQNYAELLVYVPLNSSVSEQQISCLSETLMRENITYNLIDFTVPNLVTAEQLYLLQNLLTGFFGIGRVFAASSEQKLVDPGIFFDSWRNQQKSKLDDYVKRLYENDLDDDEIEEYQDFEEMVEKMKKDPYYEQEEFQKWFATRKLASQSSIKEKESAKLWGIELVV